MLSYHFCDGITPKKWLDTIGSHSIYPLPPPNERRPRAEVIQDLKDLRKFVNIFTRYHWDHNVMSILIGCLQDL